MSRTASYEVASRLIEEGRLGEGVAMLRLVVRQQPHEMRSWVLLYQVLGDHGRTREAIDVLKRARHAPLPSKELGLLEMARGHLHDKVFQFREAEHALRESLRLVGPRDHVSEMCYVYLGYVYQQVAQDRAGIECYRQAVEMDPSNWEARRNLGTALRAVDTLEAGLELERVSRDGGDLAEHATREWALVLCAQHRHAEALRLLEGDDSNVGIWYRSYVLVRMERLEAAGALLTLHPDRPLHPIAMWAAMVVAERLGERACPQAVARDELAAAMQEEPEAYWKAVRILWDVGPREDAIALMKATLARDPDHPYALWMSRRLQSLSCGEADAGRAQQSAT